MSPIKMDSLGHWTNESGEAVFPGISDYMFEVPQEPRKFLKIFIPYGNLGIQMQELELSGMNLPNMVNTEGMQGHIPGDYSLAEWAEMCNVGDYCTLFHMRDLIYVRIR